MPVAVASPYPPSQTALWYRSVHSLSPPPGLPVENHHQLNEYLILTIDSLRNQHPNCGDPSFLVILTISIY